MKPWMRYALGLLFLIWLFGNIPAWLLLPTYTSRNGPPHQVSYAIYWSMALLIVPCVTVLAGICFVMLREFCRWIIGPRPTRESRAERIERLERELGIGQ